MGRVMSGLLRWATIGMVVWLTILNNNHGEGATTTTADTPKGICSSPWKPKSTREKIHGSDVQPEMEDPCSEYDGDACGCALTRKKCDFIVKDGLCVKHKKECGLETAWPGECRRAEGFYPVGGRICENLVQSGDCDRDTSASSNFGVNLNGLEFTDSTNVHYDGQNDTSCGRKEHIDYKNASHPYISICKLEGRGTEVEVSSYRWESMDMMKVHYDMRNLGLGYVEGSQGHSSGSRRNNRCLKFLLQFKEDGIFELNIKTGEMEYPPSGSKVRLFDIKFNDITVFPKVEPIRLAGKECFVVDLFLNMVVRKGQEEIILGGFPPKSLYRDGTTLLEFCPAGCGGRHQSDESWDDNFVAMAASLTKLKAAGDPSILGMELDSDNEIIT